MGGIVAMRLAISRPDLVRSLVLLDTTADPEPYKLKYQMLNLIVRCFGLAAVVKAVMPALYGKSTLKDPARAEEVLEWQQQLAANRRSIWRAAAGVFERKSIHGELHNIAVPTLVAVGDEDVGTPPAMAERIAKAIAGAKLMVIPGAGHGSTVEQPALVSAAISAFLDAQEQAGGAGRIAQRGGVRCRYLRRCGPTASRSNPPVRPNRRQTWRLVQDCTLSAC